MPKPRNLQPDSPQDGNQTVAGSPTPTAKPKADWEAIERDYRTGRFSDQELADKHGNVVSRQAISKKAKNPKNPWTKDLSNAIRLATNAKLIEAQVKERVAGEVAEKVAGSCDATLTAVLAAAELNKQVILGHRSDIAKLREITMVTVSAIETQLKKDAEDKKPGDPAGVLLSIQRATQSLTRLQLAERKAFGLDEEQDPAGADAGNQPTLTLAQRASRLATLFAKAKEAEAVANSQQEPGDAA